jgi:predicted dehydrogenase
MNLWLIGSGPMAQAYARVLQALGAPFTVIGRGEESAHNFQSETGVTVQAGGLAQALSADKAPDTAIVAVGVEQLTPTTKQLIQSGTRRILLEKPGGLNVAELSDLEAKANSSDAQVWLAYNRRFYASTLRAEEMIAEDGGVTSFHFEFTEWSHQIQYLQKAPGVMDHWVLGNSSHVLDLAFHLGGFPKNWNCWSEGGVDWHPASSRYCGAGFTEKGALFSYLADWEAPGRWGVEVMTRKRRLIFRPMEKLQIMPLSSVKVESMELSDQLDLDFKPGLYRQTQSFLSGDGERFCTLDEQVEHAKLYSRIAGYL